MEQITIKEIVKAIEGEYNGRAEININEVSTDTRCINNECLFVALQGERFDGHEFINAAFLRGAVCCLAHKKGNYSSDNVIYVDNTEKAFLKLSSAYKEKFDLFTVGVTGSVGKTTTKDIIAAILSKKYNTIKTIGNLNNRIGLPKTIFNIDRSTKAAVLEMGMSDLGEISELSCAVRPDIAVITNIGVSHIENLKTRENILKAKLEILEGMKNTAPVVINYDNDLLSKIESLSEHKVITYGIENKKAQYRAENIIRMNYETIFDIIYPGGRIEGAIIPAIGDHNVLNALCGFAVGIELSIDPMDCISGMVDYVPSGMRQKIVDFNGIKIIEDCYNASPDSMKAAINVLSSIDCRGKRIAVLGDMLELGEQSMSFHKEIGSYLANKKIDCLMAYGDMAKGYFEGANENCNVERYHFSDKAQLSERIKNMLCKDDIVLFKASRGMKLEDVISEIYEEC